MTHSESEEKKGFRDLLGEVIVPKIEMISLVVLSIGFLLKYLETGNSAGMIAIGLTTLAVTSYLLAFLHKPNGILQIITFKMGHIACSVALVGVMFTLLHLPGNVVMLQIGAAVVAIAFILTTFTLLKDPSQKIKRTLLRYGLVLALSLTTILA